MAVSYFALIVLALVGLVLVGGTVLLVALLANPRTRAAGATVLVIGLVVLVGGGLVALLWVSHAVPAAHRAREVARAEVARMEAEQWAAEQHALAEQHGGAELTQSPGDRAPDATETPGETETPTPPADPVDVVAESSDEQPAADAESAAETATEDEEDGSPAGEEPSAGAAGSSDKGPAAAEPRPQWVDRAPGWAGSAYQVAVTTPPRPTRQDCEAELPEVLAAGVSVYVQTALGHSSRVAQQVELSPTYLQEHIVKQSWSEPLSITLPGKWEQLHVLLEFDQEARRVIERECTRAQQRIEEAWAQATVQRRLWYSGTGLAAVLMLLSVAYASLKVDQTTSGSCRGRLCLGAGVATLLVAACALATMVYVHDSAGPIDVAPTDRLTGAEASSASGVGGEYGILEAAPPSWPGNLSAIDLTEAQSSVDHARLSLAFVLVPVVLLVAAGTVALVAWRKTRVVGLVLLAVVVIGGLILVS